MSKKQIPVNPDMVEAILAGMEAVARGHMAQMRFECYLKDSAKPPVVCRVIIVPEKIITPACPQVGPTGMLSHN